MKDELHHKLGLFKKYRDKFSTEELKKRLGLKEWEYEYIARKSGVRSPLQK